MAVKFVPVDPAPQHDQRKDRENLAEVIDLRSKIVEIEEQQVVAHATVMKDATRTLARKAMSSGELRLALTRSEHASELIEEVIQNFEHRHFLDDTALAEALAEKLRTTKRMSSVQISRKLSERLISREVISEVLDAFDREDERAMMREVAFERARKLGSLDRATAERRLAGYLPRRGWGGAGLTEVIREALDSEGCSSSLR